MHLKKVEHCIKELMESYMYMEKQECCPFYDRCPGFSENITKNVISVLNINANLSSYELNAFGK